MWPCRSSLDGATPYRRVLTAYRTPTAACTPNPSRMADYLTGGTVCQRAQCVEVRRCGIWCDETQAAG